MMSVEYIAGFFDGEGSVNIKQNIGCSPSISLGNTNKFVLEEILIFLKDVGLNFRLYNYHRKSRYKDIYHLHTHDSRSIKAFCLMLKPYCIVKRNQISLMLNYLNLYQRTVSRRVSDIDCALRFAYAHEMRELNIQTMKHMKEKGV